MDRADMSRLILPASLSIKKIKLMFFINYRTVAGAYPFGFRRLSFLRCAFDPVSYVVASLPRTKFVDWVSDAIWIKDQYGRRESTCTEEGIKIYAGITESGVLEYEVAPSSATAPVSLARNVKTLYVKIPLSNRSLKSLEFSHVEDR